MEKERKALIDSDNNLSISKQCKLLGISRSSVYYEPKKPSKEDILIMRAIDKQYLKSPFYGRRRMKEVLNRQGFKIGQKKVASLMNKMNLRTKDKYP